MNPLRLLCMVTCLAAVALASHSSSMGAGRGNSNSLHNSLKPSEWLSPSQLAALPSVQEITLEKLEGMSPQEGADLLDTIYHLAQVTGGLQANYVPNKRNLPVYIMKPNGNNVSTTLDKLTVAAQNEPNFGEKEVTVVITGLPSKTQSIKKANRKLAQAFMERFDTEYQQQQWHERRAARKSLNQGSSNDYEEDYDETQQGKSGDRTPTGSLVIIDLGEECKTLKRTMTLDVEKTGEIIGEELAKLSKQIDTPMHLLGQQIGAHVAGEAAREFKRLTGHKIRRITALDPAKQLAKKSNTISGLARGDADFVDAIHTTAYGLGTPLRVGDVDFYPNGPSGAVEGCDNVVEASMRATRYFAESVRPGNEHNFPAIAARSLKDLRNNNGSGKRAYMGIATEFDLKGDYCLEVNRKAPFGQSTPAERQLYQKATKGGRSNNGQDY